MPVVTAATIRAHLASGALAPLYLLVGADEVEKAAVAGQFADTVEEGLRAFNVDRFYGGEVTVEDLMDAARTLPMMAPRRIVTVLEAEKLLVPKRESKAADESLASLETFLENPPDHATVVFVCGTLDMRRRVSKLLAKVAGVVDCGTIEDEADAERWVEARAARDTVSLDRTAVRALVQQTGINVARLRAGLERVQIYTYGQAAITAADVREAVTAGPEAQADFGVAKAIWRSDCREALRELERALEGGAVPVMLMGQLRAAAEKAPAQRLRAALDAVFRTDLALKSSGGDPRILLERLVVELCPTRSL
jgi:DNA polymerase III subunit delta